LDRVRHETLVVHLDGNDLRAEPGEDLERPIVRRRLDENTCAGPDELLGEEDEALQRSARDHDLRGLDAVSLGEQLAQRAVAAAGAVAEDRAAIALDCRARALRELLDGETLRSRDTTGKRDHTRSVTALAAIPAARAVPLAPTG